MVDEEVLKVRGDQVCGLEALRRSEELMDVSYGYVKETERDSKYGVSERVSW